MAFEWKRTTQTKYLYLMHAFRRKIEKTYRKKKKSKRV